jgi:hypothetical protein
MLHYRTQVGQPMGSESRKCEKCGIMVWPEVDPTIEYTEILSVWQNDPNNCRSVMKELTEQMADA